MGNGLCQGAMKRLLLLGSRRSRKLFKAERNNTAAPLDGRFLKQTKQFRAQKGFACKRETVAEFLEEIYQKIAEPMPETVGFDASEAEGFIPVALRFRRLSGKEPKSQASLATGRLIKPRSKSDFKLLPPGTFTDYLRLLNARLPSDCQITLQMFCNVWRESFRHRMGIRPKTQHATCSICLKHKMILKRLSDNHRARKCQMDEYQRHLQMQYGDRVVYWSCRALSRMITPASTGYRTFCVAIDGLGHSKFRYPRSAVFASRDFAGLHRPCLDCTGVLVHGCAALLVLSEPMTAKDSSLHAEILYHVYHRLHQKHHDLRSACLVLQTDNTSRECKNGTVLRALASLVAGHKLKRAEARQLQAGHHHEDIDQFFSSVSSAIQAKAEVHLPADFVQLLTGFLQKPGTRPHEAADKECFLLDTVRDWTSGSIIIVE